MAVKPEPPTLLTTEEVAELLRLPAATLRWWRHRGSGPKSFKLGAKKVFYKKSDVDAWIDAAYNAEEAR